MEKNGTLMTLIDMIIAVFLNDRQKKYNRLSSWISKVSRINGTPDSSGRYTRFIWFLAAPAGSRFFWFIELQVLNY